MKGLVCNLAACCLIAALAMVDTTAYAQATRTWVSGVGDDANPCSRTAPCKTFAGAISKTAAGGEINCIDSGGFGAVTITKAITIDGEGVLASILATGNGIVINAGVNDVVVLRNLSIKGTGLATNGIRYLNGKELNVENCRIQGFTTHGIDVSKTSGGRLAIRDSIISRCNTTGLLVTTTGGSVFSTLENVRFNDCPIGVNAASGSRVAARNCDFTLCTNGLIAQHSGLPARAEVDTCKFCYCNNAIQSGPGAQAVVRLTKNLIDNNTMALFGNGGTFVSAQDNILIGNTSDGAVPTIVLPK